MYTPCLPAWPARVGSTGHLLRLARSGHYAYSVEQDIRFCQVDGRRLAYATVGEGPLLAIGMRFVSHLEEDWEDAGYRAFVTELAETHRVVRFDRLGAGLSDRALDEPPTNERDARSLAAVLDVFGDEPATLFAVSCAAASVAYYARSRPDRTDSLVFFGGFAARDDVPDEKKRSLVEFVGSNWGLGSQVLASIFIPRGSGDDLEALATFQRRSASAAAAAAFLDLEFRTDMRALLAQVVAPALVLHRRGDRAVPIALGRELASILPNARFVPLEGESHLPWTGDRRDTMRAVRAFLQTAPAETNGASPLSRRETEVLSLVATGLSNREIASTLILSEHTVHRHVANILRKLAQSSRAAAAAQAARAGLI
jgi:pimeloyl-ACP methyl ester carboxylesterase/DNA-binding CsgD family transcriptional regulator